MATASKSKSFQRNLLLSIGGVFLLFAICFSVYQYKREKEYKIDILHSRLQMYNYEMVQTVGKDSMSSSRLFRDYVLHHQMEGLRVSVIDKDGSSLIAMIRMWKHWETICREKRSSRLCERVVVMISNECQSPLTRLTSIQQLVSVM